MSANGPVAVSSIRELNEQSTRDAISRVRFRLDETLNEFQSKEMGSVDAEELIERIRQRLHEDFTMMVGVELR